MACTKCKEHLDGAASWIRGQLFVGDSLLPEYDWRLIAEALAKQVEALRKSESTNGE